MLHVGHDMNEKEKNDDEADEAAAAKETHESNEETWKSEDLSRKEEPHPQRRNNV